MTRHDHESELPLLRTRGMQKPGSRSSFSLIGMVIVVLSVNPIIILTGEIINKMHVVRLS
jgi:hypothetical protein